VPYFHIQISCFIFTLLLSADLLSTTLFAPWFCSFRLWRFINHLVTYLLYLHQIACCEICSRRSRGCSERNSHYQIINLCCPGVGPCALLYTLNANPTHNLLLKRLVTLAKVGSTACTTTSPHYLVNRPIGIQTKIDNRLTFHYHKVV